MVNAEPQKWLLLIHQIPPKPNALRVKIWRRLQQVGAVAIKQSVYVIPQSDQSREDLSWILKEIVAGGGGGSISEARFLEGLSDEQILALFQKARKVDYEKLIQEINALLADMSSNVINPHEPAARGNGQISKLQRRLDEIKAIDFFQAPERSTAELLIRELSKSVSEKSISSKTASSGVNELKDKIWVTRKNLFVDRIACGWLIRRFVDQKAVFKFVAGSHYTPRPNEVRFDMFDGEYSHEGDKCTFEIMIQRLQFRDHALSPLAKVVHDIDLKDGKFGLSQTDGFNALLTGLVAAYQVDDQRMKEGYRLFNNLYAFYERQKST